MGYSTLIGDRTTSGSIKNAVNWDRIDPVAILDEAEKWIYSKLRTYDMMVVESVAIAADATSVSTPTGYLDPIQFAIPGVVNRLKHWDLQRFQTRLGWDSDAVLPVGPPTIFTRAGASILLNTKADQAYTGKLAFYKSPTPLSVDNEENWLTERYPSLLRRATTMFAAEARKEYDLYDRSELRAMQAIDEIKKESDLNMRGMELDFNWEESQ